MMKTGSSSTRMYGNSFRKGGDQKIAMYMKENWTKTIMMIALTIIGSKLPKSISLACAGHVAKWQPIALSEMPSVNTN